MYIYEKDRGENMEDDEYRIVFGKKFPKYIKVRGMKIPRLSFRGLDPEMAVPEEREPTIKDILDIIRPSWSTNIIYPCEYAFLYYLHKIGVIRARVLKLIELPIDIERIEYEKIEFAGFPFEIFDGHHYPKDVSIDITYSLVVYRNAAAHLIVHYPTGFEYDGESKPCENVCKKGFEFPYWKRCLDCEERVGSLPILFEVGGVTSLTKVYNGFAYEVWVVSYGLNPKHRKILAVHMVKSSGEMEEICSKILDYLRSRLPKDFRWIKQRKGEYLCPVEELLRRHCPMHLRDGPLCDFLYDPSREVDEELGENFLRVIEEGVKGYERELERF